MTAHETISISKDEIMLCGGDGKDREKRRSDQKERDNSKSERVRKRLRGARGGGGDRDRGMIARKMTKKDLKVCVREDSDCDV